MHRRGSANFALAACLALFPAWAAVGAKPSPEQVEFFEKRVRGVLVERCSSCHSSKLKEPKGGLRLDSRAGLQAGGDSGPAVLPGKPLESRLIEAVGYANPDVQMPPKGKLPANVIADLATWVRDGAAWPQEDSPVAPAVNSTKQFDLEGRKASHWAWKPIRPTSPPLVRDAAWPRDAVDRFLLAKLEAAKLQPAAPADRATLLRRTSFDLIGLPPSPAEVDAFLGDPSPNAFEKVVDRLLSSPEFGERWGRHWLDVVRYAESRGHEHDYTIPNAHHFRDYVIRALNADVPYDQFVTEQIAGDLLPKPRLDAESGANESLVGSGFWHLGEAVHSPVDLRQDEADRYDNMIDVSTKAFLGLTVACARCHDHKFDAISTKDYYALAGFLASSNYRQAPFDALDRQSRTADELAKLRSTTRPKILASLSNALAPTAKSSGRYLAAAAASRSPRPLKAKLDAALLSRWQAATVRAGADADDPLHLWARILSKQGETDGKTVAAELADEMRTSDATTAALKSLDYVVDFAAKVPAWRTNGAGFGRGPSKVGELFVGGKPTNPDVRFLERVAAQKQPWAESWTRAPGVQEEPGALAALHHGGGSWRTPSFTVTTGKLYYLIHGKAKAYAAVDGHVMIAGPLHGQLVQPIHAKNGFRWAEHDLSAYKGQHVYVDFSPDPKEDFALAAVVQAEKAPPLFNPRTLTAKLVESAATVEQVASAYETAFLQTVAWMDRGSPSTDRDAAEFAALANCLLRVADCRAVLPAIKTVLIDEESLFRKTKTTCRFAPSMQDGSGVDFPVYLRGSPKTPGEIVPRRLLEALVGQTSIAGGEGSGRLELAAQMVDPHIDPFLPRVMVNRIWSHLFGRGIVASVDNFGVLGEAPTHPELLDFLADRFVREGWSIKRTIRELVLTNAYQMASQDDPAAKEKDPSNLLLHRMPVRRLEGEAIRDAMLATSGRLNRSMYGPAVPVYLTAFQDGRGRPASGPLDGDGRRSIYLAVRRNFLSSFLLAFDTPIPFSTVGRRTVSNVPAQSLILMNDPFVHQQAELWARRICVEQAGDPDRIVAMYRQAFARPATSSEIAACLDFIRERSVERGKTDDGRLVWKELAHVLFNAKEFIFLY